MPAANERRIAVFLDFENLVSNTGVTAVNFDLQPAISRLLEKGKVIVRRAYCDWSRFKDAKEHLHELGVELIDVPPSTRAGKNGADMRLVIDALELCYAREYLDTFVIGSGDSDFCPLAYKLRENNRQVIGLGYRESTSRLFVKACDEFIYLKASPSKSEKASKAEKPEKAEKTEEGGGRRRSRRGTKEPKAAKEAAEAKEPEAKTEATPEAKPEAKPAKPAAPKREIPPIARSVVSSLLARATGPINPSLIKETIIRQEPDFDERDHGFSTFSKLLESMEGAGLLRRQQLKGRQWYVVPADSAPPPEPGSDFGVEEDRADEGHEGNGGEGGDDELPF